MKTETKAALILGVLGVVAAVVGALFTHGLGLWDTSPQRSLTVELPAHDDGVLPSGPASVTLRDASVKAGEYAFVLIQNVNERVWHVHACAASADDAICGRVAFGNSDDATGPWSIVGAAVDTSGKNQLIESKDDSIAGDIRASLGKSLLAISAPKTARRLQTASKN